MKFRRAGVAIALLGSAIAGVAATSADRIAGDPPGVQVRQVVQTGPLPAYPPPHPHPPKTPEPPQAPEPLPGAVPAGALPTRDELIGILNGLAMAGVPAADKGALVEGGMPPATGNQLDSELDRGVRTGALPLSFDVSNIQPDGPVTARATVIISSPKSSDWRPLFAAFVHRPGGWTLSQNSIRALVSHLSAV